MRTALSRGLSPGLLSSVRQRTALFRTVLTSRLTAQRRFFGCRKHAVKFSAPWSLLDPWAALPCPVMSLRMHLLVTVPALRIYHLPHFQFISNLVPSFQLNRTSCQALPCTPRTVQTFANENHRLCFPFLAVCWELNVLQWQNYGEAIFHSPFLLQIPRGRTYQSATPTAAKQLHDPPKPALPGIILLDKDHNKPIQFPPICS